jgi:hypothetical protein
MPIVRPNGARWTSPRQLPRVGLSGGGSGASGGDKGPSYVGYDERESKAANAKAILSELARVEASPARRLEEKTRGEPDGAPLHEACARAQRQCS